MMQSKRCASLIEVSNSGMAEVMAASGEADIILLIKAAGVEIFAREDLVPRESGEPAFGFIQTLYTHNEFVVVGLNRDEVRQWLADRFEIVETTEPAELPA